MFEKSKQRRMMIMEQLGGKRDRLPSAERRKMVEEDYNKFVKTMSDFKHAEPRPSSSQIESRGNLSEQRILDQSPSVTDLSPGKPEHPSGSLENEFYEQDKLPENSSLNLPTPVKKPQEPPIYESKQVQQEQKEPQKKEQQGPQKREQPQVKIEPQAPVEPMVPQTPARDETLDLNNLKEEHSQVKNSQDNIVEEEIKMPSGHIIVNKSNSDSNNNSEAIFFTSQFKQYLNKQEPLSSPPKPVQEEPTQHKSESPEQPKTELKVEKTLKENPSGQSLAISNESSLKYSINDSAIHDVITKKLSQQLVIDSVGYQSSLPESLINWAGLLTAKEHIKDMIELGKQIRVRRMTAVYRKEEVFLRLMAHKELKFGLRLGQIKVGQFAKQHRQNVLRKCFQGWKSWLINRENLVKQKQDQHSADLKSKVFRTFKMLLFDRRINSQIDTYYLSKLFFALKSATDKQSKRSNHRAYKLYFKNLKKRYFRHLIQGVSNLRRQLQAREAAEEHYYFTFMRRYFEAWKERAPREQRFVRLALTTKNVLRETADHRLLQTRTIDFREIR